jgi:hypothetical protein
MPKKLSSLTSIPCYFSLVIPYIFRADFILEKPVITSAIAMPRKEDGSGTGVRVHPKFATTQFLQDCKPHSTVASSNTFAKSGCIPGVGGDE